MLSFTTFKVVFLWCFISVFNNVQINTVNCMNNDDSFFREKRITLLKEKRKEVYQLTYSSPKEAIKPLHDYIRLSKWMGSLEGESYAYHLLGYCYGKTSDYELQYKSILKSLDLACGLDTRKREAAAYSDLGCYYIQQGDLKSALLNFKTCFDISVSINNELMMARSLINIGEVYKIRGEYFSSLRHLLKAFNLIEDYKLYGYYPSVYYQLGDIYYQFKENLKALELYREGYYWALKRNNSSRIAEGLLKIAVIQREFNNYHNSVNYLMMADSISIQNNFIRQRALNRYEMANLCLEKEDFKNAYENITKSISILNNTDDTFFMNKAYLVMTQVFKRTNNLASGMNYCLGAIKYSLETGDIVTLKEARFTLYEICKGLGDNFNALKNFEVYEQLNLKLTKEYIKGEAYFRNNLNKKEDSISNQKRLISIPNKDNALINKKEGRKKGAFFLILFVVGASGYLWVLNWRIKNKNRKLEKKRKVIESQSVKIKESLVKKELEVREIHHRVKNNFQIINSLLELQAETVLKDDIRDKLLSGKNRVQTMFLLHEELYGFHLQRGVCFRGFFWSIMNHLKIVYNILNIKVKLRTLDYKFDLDTLTPLSLILNELISNAFKHAYIDVSRSFLYVSLFEHEQGVFRLIIKDNGVGYTSQEHTNGTSSSGLGIFLVKQLVKQLHGQIEQENLNGCKYVIIFKSTEKRKM